MINTDKDFVEVVYDALHGMPEKGFVEFKTTEYIKRLMSDMGYEVKMFKDSTGLIAVMDSGRDGINLGVRADIDALEYPVEGSCEKVCIHACGHDANSSMVLAAAKNISETGIKKGKLVFIFQPAEESGHGAVKVIDTGLLNDLDEIMGIHLRPIQEARAGEATPALFHGASRMVHVRICGKTAHGARPHLGINAVEIASSIISGVGNIKIDPRISHSIKATGIRCSNETYNVIPDEADIFFDIRAQDNETMGHINNKLVELLSGIDKAYKSESTLEILSDLPGANYDRDMMESVENSIIKVLGKSLDPIYTPGGEDFHNYSMRLNLKSAYIGLGADLKPGLHDRDMSFDRNTLGHGRDIITQVIKDKLF